MTHSILIAAPLVVASLVLVLGFVGCFLDSTGEAPPETREEYKEVIVSHPNLIGYWRLSETTGEPIAADSSAAGNDGQYVGDVTLEQPGLLFDDSNTAAQFDGSTGHVDLPFVLDPSGAFTIECLVRPDGLEGLPTIVSQRDGTGTGRSLLFVDASGNYASNLGGTGQDSGFTAAVDTMRQVVLTYAGGAGGAWIFYVDGIQTATDTVTGDPADGGWLIGTNKTLTEFWSGTIDEVAVYNAVLDPGTILDHFTLATTGDIPE